VAQLRPVAIGAFTGCLDRVPLQGAGAVEAAGVKDDVDVQVRGSRRRGGRKGWPQGAAARGGRKGRPQGAARSGGRRIWTRTQPLASAAPPLLRVPPSSDAAREGDRGELNSVLDSVASARLQERLRGTPPVGLRCFQHARATARSSARVAAVQETCR
jgi:hypothetical protein